MESAGNLTVAAALYEQALANPAEPRQEEARFRLGLLRARLGEPTFDPEAAESLLGAVAGTGTESRSAEAALILELLRKLQERSAEVDSLRAELASEGAERARLQTQLEESRRRLQQVTAELQKLKDIDRERRLRRP
jgi:chromosome segregation ATPase